MTAPPIPDNRLQEVLQAACWQVKGDPGGILKVDASGNEIEVHAATIEEGILAALRGDPLPELPQSHLSRRVLQRIRASLVRGFAELTPPPDGPTVLKYLGAVEAVAAAIETDWQQRFNDRLSGPDGPELVVEVVQSAYNALVPAFEALFEDQGRDFMRFY